MKKHCNKCDTTKDTSEFYRNNKAKDGLASHCKACKIAYSRRYREDNLEACRNRERDYAKKNRAQKNAAVERFMARNPDKKKEYQERYLSKPESREKRKEWVRVYMNKKRRSSEIERLKLICRSRIHIALRRKGFRKTSRTFKTLGCSPEFLISHLEGQFKKGMTWDNFGDWHIDHIVPLSRGSTKEEILELSHYSNLQPLWAKENRAKGARYLG